MKIKRLYFLSTIILIIIILLLMRLMQISLFQTEHFSKHQVNLLEESVKQRTQNIFIDDGRGEFIDRNGKPLSFEEKSVVVLFPFLKNIHWETDKVAKILNVSASHLEQKIEHSDEPFIYGEITVEQVEQLEALQIPGVIPITSKTRPKKVPAAQFIGIVGENNQLFEKRYPEKKGTSNKIGITGMQKQFDEFLFADRPSKLIFHVDAMGNPLFGLNVKYTEQSNPHYPLTVKTTIDKDIQEEMEAVVNQYPIEKGGLLLLDIESNSIVAVVSKPDLNPNKPFSDSGTKNLLFEEQIPGSVFKTVVAAAAIEEGVVHQQDQFDCSLDIRGDLAKKDLGTLNFKKSFARSCNRTFAELAKQLQEKDSSILEKYAKKLGLLGYNGWEGDVFQIDNFIQFNYDSGRIFLDDDNKDDPNFISQTGIGQHEVRVSPIGVANMMAIIARAGKKSTIRAATEIQYANGGTMYRFPQQKMKETTISMNTSIQLQQLLRDVVIDQHGTGVYFQNLPYEVAGKSGTAETGIEIDGKKRYNKWFAGYFPFENPKYSLVVVNLAVPEEQGGTYDVFAEAVQQLYRHDQN